MCVSEYACTRCGCWWVLVCVGVCLCVCVSEGQWGRGGNGQVEWGRGHAAGGADRASAGEGGVGAERTEEPLPRHLSGGSEFTKELSADNLFLEHLHSLSSTPPPPPCHRRGTR